LYLYSVVNHVYARRRAEEDEPTSALFTRTQLAERLNVSHRTVDNWRERGLIPYLRVGAVIRFDFRQVIAALSEHCKEREKARSAQ
jgi:excisionase family DNA binding protein